MTQAAGDSTIPDRSVSRAISGEDPLPVAAAQTGLPIDRSEPVNTEHVDDSVLQISGTLVPRRMDRRPFGGVFGRLGILGDSHVWLLIPDTGPRWGTGGSVEVLHKHCLALTVLQYEYRDVLTAWCHSWDYRVPHPNMWPQHRCHYWNWYLGIGVASYLRMVYCLWMVAFHYNYTGLTLLCRAVFSPLAIVWYNHTQRQCFIAPCEQWAAGPCPPADYWKDLHYLQALWWASCGSF